MLILRMKNDYYTDIAVINKDGRCRERKVVWRSRKESKIPLGQEVRRYKENGKNDSIEGGGHS